MGAKSESVDVRKLSPDPERRAKHVDRAVEQMTESTTTVILGCMFLFSVSEAIRNFLSTDSASI